MRIPTLIGRPVLLLFLALLPGWATASSDTVDQVQGAVVLGPTETLDTVADAGKDTLKACLARIPNTATRGQRMLAEQNCQGDEATRKDPARAQVLKRDPQI
jgi:hypothetical protein